SPRVWWPRPPPGASASSEPRLPAPGGCHIESTTPPVRGIRASEVMATLVANVYERLRQDAELRLKLCVTAAVWSCYKVLTFEDSISPLRFYGVSGLWLICVNGFFLTINSSHHATVHPSLVSCSEWIKGKRIGSGSGGLVYLGSNRYSICFPVCFSTVKKCSTAYVWK
ncbi:unnamed protein product, partial [Urochloa humidicola]